jgi:hypothetical protein
MSRIGKNPISFLVHYESLSPPTTLDAHISTKDFHKVEPPLDEFIKLNFDGASRGIWVSQLIEVSS